MNFQRFTNDNFGFKVSLIVNDNITKKFKFDDMLSAYFESNVKLDKFFTKLQKSEKIEKCEVKVKWQSMDIEIKYDIITKKIEKCVTNFINEAIWKAQDISEAYGLIIEE